MLDDLKKDLKKIENMSDREMARGVFESRIEGMHKRLVKQSKELGKLSQCFDEHPDDEGIEKDMELMISDILKGVDKMKDKIKTYFKQHKDTDRKLVLSEWQEKTGLPEDVIEGLVWDYLCTDEGYETLKKQFKHFHTHIEEEK